MKSKRNTMISISLVIGLILVTTGAANMSNQIKGANVLFVLGFAVILICAFAVWNERRENDKYKPLLK